MGMKEEITDLISDKGIMELKVGQVLGFNYEGSVTRIKVTKIDRKNMRIWGEHVDLIDVNTGMSHYGHDLDRTQSPPWCNDCQVPVNVESTEDGDMKAAIRQEQEEKDAASSSEPDTK